MNANNGKWKYLTISYYFNYNINIHLNVVDGIFCKIE